ncbi:hypothetical protein ERO13_A01G159950v2 [Gossypium hirsutum]|nr:hypothetical protein ERO13_A01G159950v2 [Gossypium hirsutum]
MSNSVGQNLIQQHFLRPTVLEHQIKLKGSSGIASNSLCATASLNQSLAQPRKYQISTKFYGNSLSKRKHKLAMGSQRPLAFIPQAVLATDPASENLGKFNIDGNIELQCSYFRSITNVNFRVMYTSDSLLLHWGAIRGSNDKWVLPSRQPEGTKNHKNRALRTPFVKSGSSSYLKLEIDDPQIQAIEFLIFDEARNKWQVSVGFVFTKIKNNGQNFHVKLPRRKTLVSNISVPEDLVQIQAYLRWERKGKQMYTPEQEKASNKFNNYTEEYEAARAELLEEISRGASVDDIRSKITKKSGQEYKETAINEENNKIPDDLVQIQAYIRWEKAGKPSYSPEQQLREFEEARKELQSELEKGASLDEIRKKITKGEIKTKVAKQLQNKKYFSPERIQRKQRDLMQLLNKHAVKAVEESISVEVEPKPLTAVEPFAKEKELDGNPVMSKKIYKVGEKELLVLVTKPAEPLTLHWALSEKDGEWLAPPPAVLPPGSVSLEKAAESKFSTSTSGDLPKQVQCIEMEIADGNFKGMPFVLLSGGKWIKNNGSDFYVEFSQRFKLAQKDAGDGKGTSKVLLDRIAALESEAQKSFMHRFNIASDLMDQAKNTGKLGLAGILVWMRFMATRQLIWNKNYNVKPREISKAQDRLTDLLQTLRMIMSTVGRGGEGDVDKELGINTGHQSDDVIICQALIDYIKSDFDISIYWKTLNENGITKERLLSYDRAIHSEPSFRRDQKDGLLHDLGHYMRTLKGQGFMVGVQINPIPGLPSGFPDLLRFVLEHIEDRNVEALLEGLLEARQELRPLLLKSTGRLKDLLTAIERGYEELNNARPEVNPSSSPHPMYLTFKIMHFITLVLENLVLSSDDNEDLVYCLKGWHHSISMCKSKSAHGINLKGDGHRHFGQKAVFGKYAISAEEFTPEMVGAKSRNISYLKGKVPSWVGIPTSVALPFGI